MNKLIPAVMVAAVLAVPAVSFAQEDMGPTHAQVQAQLAELEGAGYSPTSNQEAYPQNLIAAEQRVDAAHGMTASGYGTVAAGTSAAGGPATKSPAEASAFYRIYSN